MWIPTKIYEALPAIYFTFGTALIAGSLYIGLDHAPVLVYFILGSMCIGTGIVVGQIRRRLRSGQDRSRT